MLFYVLVFCYFSITLSKHLKDLKMLFDFKQTDSLVLKSVFEESDATVRITDAHPSYNYAHIPQIRIPSDLKTKSNE